MTIPESPIIQIERRKAIALFASVLILAVALFGGLVKIGWGISARTDSGIVVTGSARTEAVADNAVWTLSVSLSRACATTLYFSFCMCVRARVAKASTCA